MQSPPVQLPLLQELAEVDTILNRAIATGDPLVAVEYGNQLNRTIFLKGVKLAKLLSGLRANWPLFRASGIGESFEDFIEAHSLGLDASTALRYADMFESVFIKANISDALRDRLATKPIRSLLLLTAAAREGSIGEEELQEVVLKSERGIREIIKRARGHHTKSSKAIYAKIVMRDDSHFGPPGTLVVFQDGDYETLAGFNLVPQKTFTQQYLERIRNTMQIGEIV